MVKLLKKKVDNVSTTLPKEVKVDLGRAGFSEEEAVKIERLTEMILAETAGKFKDIERDDVIPCLKKIVFTRTGIMPKV